MPKQPATNERAVAELVARLGRLVYGDGFAEGLTPAQWTALRYFSRANRFSRTVSAFAEFHATTRGTASQTVKSLVENGYLHRERSTRDRRSVRFDLTRRARTLLARDPFENLVAAAGNLSNTSRQVMGHGLDCMLRAIAEHHGKKAFGTCLNCRYLSTGVCCQENPTGRQCELLGEALTEPETEQLCVNFSAAR